MEGLQGKQQQQQEQQLLGVVFLLGPTLQMSLTKTRQTELLVAGTLEQCCLHLLALT